MTSLFDKQLVFWYYLGMTLTVSNRDLLRKFKKLRDGLLSGEIEEVVVPQKNGFFIRLSTEKELTPMEKLLKMVKEKPLKGIKRPKEDIF